MKNIAGKKGFFLCSSKRFREFSKKNASCMADYRLVVNGRL